MNTDEIDGTAVVAAYFEDRITKAQKEVEKAQDALAAAETTLLHMESEQEAFARDGFLHAPAYNADTGQPEWELCQWASARAARVTFKDMTPAGDAAYKRLLAERTAVHTWLRENGYSIPEPFGGRA